MAISTRKLSRFYLFLLALIVSVAVWRAQFIVPGTMEQFFSYIAYPLLYLQKVSVEPIKKLVAQRQNVHCLREQIEQLQQDYLQVRDENIALQATFKYHKDIDELIQFQKRYKNANGHIAQILTRVFSDAQHYYFVDLGAQSGIEKDMVAVHGNCLVGRVETVYPWYSKVRLITDKACKVACHCASTDAAGIYEGSNNYSTSAVKYVSHLSELKQDDMVLSSGEGLVFPRGFALGTIVRYVCDNLYYAIAVKPALNVHSLTYCVLIKKGDIEQMVQNEAKDAQMAADQDENNDSLAMPKEQKVEAV